MRKFEILQRQTRRIFTQEKFGGRANRPVRRAFPRLAKADKTVIGVQLYNVFV